MKFFYFLLGVALLTNSLQAQQLPLFNEYSENSFMINPAMAGWDGQQILSASYRHQWTQIEEAPRSFALGYRQFFEKKNMGLAGHILRDQTGPSAYTAISASYAYQIQIGDEDKRSTFSRNRIALGFSLSAQQYELDGSKLNFNDAGDPVDLGQKDQVILPDASAGLLYIGDNLYFGVSANQLLQLQSKFETANQNQYSVIQRATHVQLQMGGRIPLHKEKQTSSVLFPSVWVKYAANAPMQVNLGLRYIWNNMLGVSANYVSNGSFLTHFSFRYNRQVQIGYTFTQPFGEHSYQLGQSHELGLAFSFNKNKNSWYYRH